VQIAIMCRILLLWLILSLLIPSRLYTLPYSERQSARMSKNKNGGLDPYGVQPIKQQQFGTAGVEGVKICTLKCY